jgi:undecaprenyl-diphosphatase
VIVPAALQALDERLLAGAHAAPPAISLPFYALTVIGGGWGLLAVVPFAAIERTRAVTSRLLAAIAVQAALVVLLKHLCARVRPCHALAWCAPLAGTAPVDFSFPSGHAAGVFAFAAFVALRWPRWGAPALAFAALVAASRVVLGVHYPSDVLAGALLGAAVGAAFARSPTRRAA